MAIVQLINISHIKFLLLFYPLVLIFSSLASPSCTLHCRYQQGFTFRLFPRSDHSHPCQDCAQVPGGSVARFTAGGSSCSTPSPVAACFLPGSQRQSLETGVLSCPAFPLLPAFLCSLCGPPAQPSLAFFEHNRNTWPQNFCHSVC